MVVKFDKKLNLRNFVFMISFQKSSDFQLSLSNKTHATMDYNITVKPEGCPPGLPGKFKFESRDRQTHTIIIGLNGTNIQAKQVYDTLFYSSHLDA